MKNVNQIRQLLEAMVKISNTEPRSAADSVYGGLATKALTLLPCETCNIENLKLKPCPFCGGKAEELENYHMHIECFHCPPTREFVHSAVQCLRCGSVMMGTSEQWNKRKELK